MTQRKARAKSPSKVGQGPSPNKKPRNNYFATLMSTPEGRELRRQWSTKAAQKSRTPERRSGRISQSGNRTNPRTQRRKAEKVVQIMSDKFDIDDGYAKEALQTAVEIMRTPGETRERLLAAADWSRFHRQVDPPRV